MIDDIHDHDRGLAHDLQLISRQMIARRRALGLFAAVGTSAFVAGCNGGGDSAVGTATTAGTGTTAAATTATATTGTTATAAASTGACIADPTETSGPYPADGTNTAQGSTSNVLTSSGVVRSDIRTSFIGSTTTAQGVLLTITLTVVNANAACAPLANYAVYLWHCDATGNYSLYSGATAESYLRGVQVTDANGQVTFTTIYPACYSGRWPHMHFEIYTSLSGATTGRAAKLISQLAMPAAVNTAVFNGSSLYAASVRNYASVSLATDGVFGDNTSAQIAAMTPAVTGSVSAGYTATATIGVSV
jgi:protocatechuate 3,4-dioxygenase beta subunit